MSEDNSIYDDQAILEEYQEEEFHKDVTAQSIQEQISTAKQLVRDNKLELAEELYSNLMESAKFFYRDNELDYEMGVIQYEYGNFLLHKMEQQSDLFGEMIAPQKEAEQVSNTIPAEKVEQKENGFQMKPKQDNNIIFQNEDVQICDESKEVHQKPEEKINANPEEQIKQKETSKEESKEEEKEEKVEEVQESQKMQNDDNVDDVQVAWENIATAKMIFESKLEALKQQSGTSKLESLTLIHQIAKVNIRMGDLEIWMENFIQAQKEYQQGLDLSISCEEFPEFSREISVLHFTLANSYLYETGDFENIAIKHYISACQILENILNREINLPQKKLPSFETIQLSDLNKDHLKVSFLDTEYTKEIKSIIEQLYNKIEDTLEQRNQKEMVKQAQEKMKAAQTVSNSFAPVDNKNVNVINIGTFGNAGKRKQPAQENNDNKKDTKENIEPEPKSETKSDNKAENVIKTNDNDSKIEKKIKID